MHHLCRICVFLSVKGNGKNNRFGAYRLRYGDHIVEMTGAEGRNILVRSEALSILVLDEPTAALDPIAENELYKKYSALTTGKTSVYISHRFASTRFCDRIVLLEKGEITECGAHCELMAKQGRYAELFNVQSKYYKEGEINE